MSRVRETEVTAYAHCGDPHCAGSRQEEVDAIHVETEVTYMEKGGDAPGVENSHVHYRLVDPEKRLCPGCGKTRELTGEPRKVYQPLSGHSPEGLLKFGAFDPSKRVDPNDERVAALEAQVERLAAALEKQVA